MGIYRNIELRCGILSGRVVIAMHLDNHIQSTASDGFVGNV